MNGIASSVLQLCVAAYLSIMRRRAYAASKWYCAVDARHSSEMRVYPDVRAVAAFGAGAVSCEEAASRERSRSLPANILLIEWGEKFPRFVRERNVEIVLERIDENERRIQVTGQ